MTITPDQSDVLQMVDLSAVTGPGKQRIEIKVHGDIDSIYQIVNRYYLPWAEITPSGHKGNLDLNFSYDRTETVLGQPIIAGVTIKNSGNDSTPMAVAKLGIPAGFSVGREDFKNQLENGDIARYEIKNRFVVIYLQPLDGGSELSFDYQLTPEYPTTTQVPKCEVYDYYNPEKRAEFQPVKISVTEK
ncbi:hypothetical protein ACFL54_08370 [Planctomycetota bacterium]